MLGFGRVERKRAALSSMVRKLLNDLEFAGCGGADRRRVFMRLLRMEQEQPDRLRDGDPAVERVLILLLEGGDLPNQELANLTSALLKRRLMTRLCSEQAFKEDALLMELEGDALFSASLRWMWNVDLELERVLGHLRKSLLKRWLGADSRGFAWTRLTADLACQADRNAYIMGSDDEEDRALRNLRADLVKPETITSVSRVLESRMACWAMYRPLAEIPFSKELRDRPLSEWSDFMRPLLSKQWKFVRERSQYFDEISVSRGPMTPTSQAVALQYDERPYHCWDAPSAEVVEIRERLARVNVSAASQRNSAHRSDRAGLLVVGCGTGQSAVDLALAHPKTMVTAVDISRTSLAYAAWMADRLDVSNITFVHEDFRELPQHGLRYEHVECVGVLHALEEPGDAWRILGELMVPGGTLHVGVYSEIARLGVLRARQEIQRLGVLPTDDAMRGFRDQLVMTESYQALLNGLKRAQEFYNLSLFRSYLFNALEHCFTVSSIEKGLRGAQLQFLGVEIPRQLRAAFERRFPNCVGLQSVDQWKSFEREYAGSLAMFLFWARKEDFAD